MSNELNETDILDHLITGRVSPSIYAFITNTVPNYLKVGDTYRPVSQRLKEWSFHYPDLIKKFEDKAKIDDDIYFRDYAVHKFLVGELKKERLNSTEDQTYYSNEFFKDTTPSDINSAINDIKESYVKNPAKYVYYDVHHKLPKTYTYKREQEWPLRPNQQVVVNNFKRAYETGRKNLLMYAVMRFGKSFTALCCALEMEAKIVLVVSAKADVKDEWKKTVEKAGNFKDYIFLDTSSLEHNEDAIREGTSKNNRVVIFLTLQDLQGTTLKHKHKEIFNSYIDLLIIDETHFGARAKEYGSILYKSKEAKNISKLSDDYIDVKNTHDTFKQLNINVKLHLSGTPYRILMSSEFEEDDIISFVQFSDIVNEKEEWDRHNLINDDVNEWDNPYFGVPQMVRFAFTPNKSSLEKMRTLKKQGIDFTLSALFEPHSIQFDPKLSNHKKFKHHSEILQLFKAIDGSEKDENIFSFLEYDKIKEGKMCRHLVIVLPYCASCDALESLLNEHSTEFKNLNDYEIINISGVNGSKLYKNPLEIKKKIKDCEINNTKTITLTVNRMLTGSTVEQWDTMLYFKDTASPQEYDQAIFRLQNQYTRELVSREGVIKENLKPQTLLIDFNPQRLFKMQEQKALIHNANVLKNGNSELRERIVEEINISPIITINHKKIKQVEAKEVLEAVSEYNSQRSIFESVKEVPIDFSILQDKEIEREIKRQSVFGSKEGLTHNPYGSQDDGDELGIPGGKSDKRAERSPFKERSDVSTDESYEENQIKKQFQTYYQRILFFAFLVKNSVNSLADIIEVMNQDDNQRISNNLYLSKNILVKMHQRMNLFILNNLDYKIQNISRLSSDESVAPLNRAIISLKKFNRMSSSEIVTSPEVCEQMINLISDEALRNIIENDLKILDIGSKSGEFSVALVNRLITDLKFSIEDISDSIYSIPTSSVAYEFTRRFYEILGLNVNNISYQFNSYDLLEVETRSGEPNYNRINELLTQKRIFSEITTDDLIKKEGVIMKFGAVVGNPPYQKMDGGTKTSASPIYQKFVFASMALNPDYISIITPARWYVGGKGLDVYRNTMLNDTRITEIVDYPNSNDVFADVEVAGGISYFLWEKNAKQKNCKVVNFENGSRNIDYRPLNEYEVFIRSNKAISIVRKILNQHEGLYLDKVVSASKPFGLRTFYKPREEGVPCQFIQKIGLKYAEFKDIKDQWGLLDKWKLLVPRSPIAGQTDFTKSVGIYYEGNIRIIPPGTCCTESYLVAFSADSLEEVNSFKSYLLTKVFRFLLLQSVASQDIVRDKFRFVPHLEDYSEVYTDKLLCEKWGITEDEWKYIDSRIHNSGK
ncbi:restriction endonuclease [Exiguobacterium sp. SH0S1]|uniref:Eco57I restriction-modification methylase domain-containing protein n=1 Tax=Exiguobacterium sp. SH0S1 TaxID=2510949 RepID=UPI00103C935B|nr:Eco57I restriction-modification methylase domain-containing protein [Exiguobacterium sp. SH0S1]TCI75698.1 restriction endonuclease [Exiguobacterium sp. SH0S1]